MLWCAYERENPKNSRVQQHRTRKSKKIKLKFNEKVIRAVYELQTTQRAPVLLLGPTAACDDGG